MRKKRSKIRKISADSSLRTRLVILILIFLLLTGMIISRLFTLQIMNGEAYENDFTLSIEKKRVLKSTRGEIYDCNGNLLAYNELIYEVTFEDKGSYESNHQRNLALNSILYNSIKIIESHGDTVYDNFKIDLDSNGDYVIIDFKWNESTTYQKKLEQNDALQLAVYKAVIEKYLKDQGDNHKVCFMGYYALPRHTLYSVYDNIKHKYIEVVIPENNADLMKLAVNSYLYRINQIKSGVIEEGENLKLADLQYVKDSNSKQLYPLRGDYNDNTLKSTSYGNKNIVLKGGLE